MKVALVVSSHHLGGGQGHALWLADALSKGGAAVLVAGRPGGTLEEEARRRQLSFAGVVPGDGPDLFGLIRLVRRLRRERIDIAHTHLNRGALWGGLAARLVGVPCVATVHGFNRSIYYRLAHRILAVSQAVADHVGSLAPGLKARIRVVPNALDPGLAPDPARSRALSRELSRESGERLLLVVGRLHPNKGQRLAVEVVARLGPGNRLIVAGDGPDRRELERLSLGQDPPRVTFLGHRSDVPDLLGAVDVVLVPSVLEAFSLAAAEALLCGVPMIAARTGGLVELVGGAGQLVEGRDPECWVAAYRSVVADLDGARIRAASARDRLLRVHAPDRILDQVQGVYSELTKGPRF